MPRDPVITHKIMSSVKSKDTVPEILLRKSLWQDGFRFRVHYKKLPGKPDITFTRAKVAIFCDGDYWHGHNWALRGYVDLEDELSHYSEFWANKIRANVTRDERVNEELHQLGWKVVRIWESDILKNAEACKRLIIDEYHTSLGVPKPS